MDSILKGAIYFDLRSAFVFKFVTIYRVVDDPDAVETLFQEIHLPAAEKLPGLVKSEVSHITGQPGGRSRFLLMYELYFNSRANFEAAFYSEPGKVIMEALRPWGEAGLITWFYAESFDEVANGER
jgi:uncharacterized protein (TIGR02118 family)